MSSQWRVKTEIGRKTDYLMEAYPGRVSPASFYNTANHDDNFKTIAGTSTRCNKLHVL